MNKNRIRLMIVGALISLSLLLAACGDSATPTPRPLATPTTVSAPAVAATLTAAAQLPTPNGTVGPGGLPPAGPTDQIAPEAQPTGNP